PLEIVVDADQAAVIEEILCMPRAQKLFGDGEVTTTDAEGQARIGKERSEAAVQSDHLFRHRRRIGLVQPADGAKVIEDETRGVAGRLRLDARIAHLNVVAIARLAVRGAKQPRQKESREHRDQVAAELQDRSRRARWDRITEMAQRL